MPRPQLTVRSLLWAMLVVAAFFGGVRFERERRRREEEYRLSAKSAPRQKPNYGPTVIGPKVTTRPSDEAMPTLKGWHSD